jgi:uncharacterized membrane protein YgdD (TMEM256/DUF423 family)
VAGVRESRGWPQIISIERARRGGTCRVGGARSSHGHQAKWSRRLATPLPAVTKRDHALAVMWLVLDVRTHARTVHQQALPTMIGKATISGFVYLLSFDYIGAICAYHTLIHTVPCFLSQNDNRFDLYLHSTTPHLQHIYNLDS